jgi:hypothetical protein
MNTPLTRPQDLTVHVGTGKAGSSSVQKFLAENRQSLRELGLLYPASPGRSRHDRLGLFVKSAAELERAPAWHKRKRPDQARFRRRFRRRLFSEIEESGLSRVLLSDEILFHRDEPGLRRLRRLTDRVADRLRLVVYLRRQDDHMVSRYQQGVKIGRVLRLRELAQEDLSSLYDYHLRLRTLHRLLAPTELVVRRFERASFVDGSLYQDFLDAVRLDVRADDLKQVPIRNESLDAESVEFLRLVNIYKVEFEGAKVGLINNRGLIRRLAAASSGPVLTLPAHVLDEFMVQWVDTNRAVAREFLGDESGELFRTPRKTSNITTEQRLDPARLDHFLDLCALPDRVHAPLRAVAEREAKTH